MTTTSLEIAQLALDLCGSDKAITAIDADACREDRLCNRHYAKARDELVELFEWAHALAHAPLVLAEKYLEYEEVYEKDPVTITGITQADPAVVTAASHGLCSSTTTTAIAQIFDVGGMTEANRSEPYHITYVSADTFQLTGIDSTNWTAYTSGGSARLMQAKTDYQDGYTYDLPSDYGHAIGLQNPATNYIIKGGKLVTTEQDAVLIYVRNDVTDISAWKNLFVNLVAHRLALKIVVALVGAKAGAELKKVLKQDYEIALYETTTAAAKEIKQDAPTESSWLSMYAQ